MTTAVIVEVPGRTRAREESKEDEDESPAKRLKGNVLTKWKWKEEEPVYCLDDDKMFFVNRDPATKQLLECHKDKYKRAVEKGGKMWTIPLVDHVFGLGKSTFGQEYIRRCKQKWDDLPEAEKVEGSFLDVVRNCHTIPIQFSPLDLLGGKGVLDVAKAERSLVTRISDYFNDNYSTLPRAVAPDAFPGSVYILLKKLTKEVGPLFIVVDEIGTPFDNVERDDDIVRSEQFMAFCKNILFPLFPVRNLFFLIAGRASFLNFVDLRPRSDKRLSNSPFKFQRLSLHLLRALSIEEIVKKTYWDERKTETIKEHFKLNDKQVTEVAVHLFQTTFGHPRSLIEAFKTCDSYKALVEYITPDLPDVNIDQDDFGRRLQYYEEPLRQLMDCALQQDSMNLSAYWRDSGGRKLTFDSIANSFGIAWDGTVNDAKLYMPSYIQNVILASVYPLEDLLTKGAPAVGQIAITYLDIFELIFLARLRGLFNEEKCPKDELPNFFTDKQKFGSCKGVCFAKSTYWMPKITRSGSKSPTLTSPTAHPDYLGPVMAGIDSLVVYEDRVNLKPLPKSASPDILLVTNIKNKTLTVGLAVKNYIRTEVKNATVKDECDKFNRMFKSKEGRLNVLIVCATVYSSKLRGMFESNNRQASKSALYPSCGFKQIDEVILLNLSTAENRADFLGIVGDPLTRVSESIIEKGPVEYITSAED